MGRINRRIYATRRKRSPNKLRFASSDSLNSEQINEMGQMQASGDLHNQGDIGFSGSINRIKHMIGNKRPPYLSDGEDETGVNGGKTYTITEA